MLVQDAMLEISPRKNGDYFMTSFLRVKLIDKF